MGHRATAGDILIGIDHHTNTCLPFPMGSATIGIIVIKEFGQFLRDSIGIILSPYSGRPWISNSSQSFLSPSLYFNKKIQDEKHYNHNHLF